MFSAVSGASKSKPHLKKIMLRLPQKSQPPILETINRPLSLFQIFQFRTLDMDQLFFGAAAATQGQQYTNLQTFLRLSIHGGRDEMTASNKKTKDIFCKNIDRQR
jgi:hypothetical protein